MGKQKGKTFPGKKASGKNLIRTALIGADRRAAAAERFAARQAARKELAQRKVVTDGSKVQAPAGLPSGWFAYKRSFQHGKLAGKEVLRFASTDGKHADVSTISQAIRKDAADKGYDPKPKLEELERQAKQKEQTKALQQKQEGLEEGGNLRKAVSAFREKHGRLDAATVANIPGWTLATREARGGQKLHMYKGPNGVAVTQLALVEASLGAEILGGRDIPGILEAQTKAANQSDKMARRRGLKRGIKREKYRRRKTLRRKGGGSNKMDVDEGAKKTKTAEQNRPPAIKKKILKSL